MSTPPSLLLVSGATALPADTDVLNYLPFGTTTLKVYFDPPADCPEGILTAAPLKRHGERERIIIAHEDYGSDLWISWGGGKAEGIHFDPSKGQRYLYFNLTHRSSTIAEDYPITIQVKDEAGNLVTARRFVAVRPAARHPLRLNWHSDWPFGSTLQWQGKHVPDYQSRWWPQQRLTFQKREVPPFTVRYDRMTTSDRWGRVVLSLAGQTLARVEGRLESALHDVRLFDADLFHFYENVWAVRLWFSWLHHSFTEGDLHADVLGKAVPLVRDGREEIPDVERFDLLVDVEEKVIRYIGTDNHYKELWGQWGWERPVQALIGHNVSAQTAFFIFAARTTDTLVSLSGSRSHTYDPAPLIRQELESGGRGGLSFEEIRDAISWEAHAPIVDDFRAQGDFIGPDVRLA